VGIERAKNKDKGGKDKQKLRFLSHESICRASPSPERPLRSRQQPGSLLDFGQEFLFHPSRAVGADPVGGFFAGFGSDMLLETHPVFVLFNAITPSTDVHERFQIGEPGENLMNLVAGKYPQKYHDHGPDGGFLNIATRPITSAVIKNEFEEFVSPQQNDYDGESDGVPDERGPPLDQLPIGCLFHILFRIKFPYPSLSFHVP
jgi:hypothetical protein